jgi:predicted metal-dependent hydrolase
MSEDLIKEKLENHEKRIENLENNTSDLKTLIYRIEVLEKKIVTMNNNLDLALKKDDEDKSKKWDKLIEYIFYAILGILLAYIAYKLGLKN